MTESVIDFPKEGLCPEIWEKVISADGMNETWQLKDEAKLKILQFVIKLLETAHLPSKCDAIHITGSITSNSYTENADIDIHFVGFHIREFAEMTQKRLSAAMKTLKPDYELTHIGKHPFEVYYQTNEFQDYMSVGCYDLQTGRWLVGPELTDQSFNPYSEYYLEIQKQSEGLAKSIRNMIFSIYEMAIAYKKNAGTDFAEPIWSILSDKLSEAKDLYEHIRMTRKVFSSPSSKEEALKNRTDRRWKIADGAFKLFDKYGYLAILKKFVEDSELASQSADIKDEIADDILKTVKNYISNADKLSEQEIYEDEELSEGAASNIVLAALLAVPGILSAKTIQRSMETQPSYSYIVNDINSKCKMVGQYTSFQAANIIARTLFAEARNDGEAGMKAVASVIYVRAQGKAADFANVCKKHAYSKKAGKDIYQFSCWNKMTDSEWSPKAFKVKLPSAVKTGTKEQKLWEKAMEIASEMLAGKFSPTVNANMYYNDQTASPEWGNQLTGVKHVGSHKFGTLKNHSAFV